MTYHDFLLQLLGIIGYTDDIEAFISRFMGTAQLQAIADLTNELDPAEQSELSNEVDKAQGDPNIVAQLLEQHFTRDQIHDASHAVILESLDGLVTAVQDKLSDTQKQQLNGLLEKVRQ